YSDMKLSDRPINTLNGIKKGVKELIENTRLGVVGVVKQPIKGYKVDGFVGVIEGIGKGTVGIVVKPMIGLLDFFQRFCEGTKNTVKDWKVMKRKERAPRYLALMSDEMKM